MLKIKLVVIGKIKESYWKDAITEYQKRLSRFCSLKIVELKEETLIYEPNKSETEKIVLTEGNEIIKNLNGRVISACIEGEKYSSELLAELIKKLKSQGEEITFVIGGSYGLSKIVKQKSNILISFSDMTFPHQMFRVMLLEQLYRAFMINENSTYHK